MNNIDADQIARVCMLVYAFVVCIEQSQIFHATMLNLQYNRYQPTKTNNGMIKQANFHKSVGFIVSDF